MAVKIADGSDVCLSGCRSITEFTRIMGLAPSQRQKGTDSSKPRLVVVVYLMIRTHFYNVPRMQRQG